MPGDVSTIAHAHPQCHRWAAVRRWTFDAYVGIGCRHGEAETAIGADGDLPSIHLDSAAGRRPAVDLATGRGLLGYRNSAARVPFVGWQSRIQWGGWACPALQAFACR